MKLSKITRLTAVGLAALLGVVGTVQPASAGRYASAGPVGAVGLPTGICTYYNAWNRLDVKVSPPAIYAPNLKAGSWNDSAWARYQVFVYNRYGQMVYKSNFSGWAASYDAQPASFSGAPLTITNIPDVSTVHIGVEWSGAGYTGAALYSLDKYLLYSGGMGPYGGMNACSKWSWNP